MAFDSQAGQRFSTVTMREGYSIEEVDVFVTRIENAIRHIYAGMGTAWTVTGPDVRDVTFTPARVLQKGYDQEEVDVFLEEAALHLKEAVAKRGDAVSADQLPQQTGSPAVGSLAYPAFPNELTEFVTRPRGERFPHSGRLTSGYNMEDVDAFVERLCAGVGGPGGGWMSQSQVRNVAFKTRRNGYNMCNVDAWMDAAEARLW